MHVALLGVLALSLTAGVPRPTPLFNGDDLTGWTAVAKGPRADAAGTATAGDLKRGRIALQAEGAEIHFRQIDLTPAK